jgi:hypothetical protein
MYTAIDTTHRPLDEIIKGLYRTMPPNARKAYEVICCLHQFGQGIPQLLLARYLDCQTTTDLFEILTPKTRDAIIEDEDRFGNTFYRSPHRIIARRTMDFFLSDPAIQLRLMENVIAKANFSVRSERGLIERLLTRDIHLIDFSYEQKKELYERTSEKQEIRSVIHHWGILEMDNNHPKEAKKLLEKAVEMKEPIGVFKGESDRNIYTSLGVLHSRIALSNYENNPDIADENLQLAESYFNKAKTIGFIGEHPYGAHASMLFEFGRLTKDEDKKLSYFTSALQIIDFAKKRGIAKKENTYLDEIELKIWAELDNEAQIVDAIDRIAKKMNSAKGYYLYARYLTKGSPNWKNLEKAYSTLVEGLAQFPDDQDCSSLRVELCIKLYPNDHKQLYTLLSNYAEQTTYPQISLLFEAVTFAFQMGNYASGLKWYQKLERISRNEENRFEPRKYLTDTFGNRKLLKGQIVKIIDQYSGEILCETLPEYPRLIRFRPIGLPVSEKDTVEFNLAFSLVDPIATNIRRI